MLSETETIAFRFVDGVWVLSCWWYGHIEYLTELFVFFFFSLRVFANHRQHHSCQGQPAQYQAPGKGALKSQDFNMYYYNGLRRKVQGLDLGPQYQQFGMRLLPSEDIRSVEQMSGTAYVVISCRPTFKWYRVLVAILRATQHRASMCNFG